MSAPPVDPSAAAGGFTGEGGADGPPQPSPKGRDDDELAAALRVRLRAFGDIDVAGVTITVDDGRVTLTGLVADGSARALVESRVDEVLGVTSVDNRLGTRGD